MFLNNTSSYPLYAPKYKISPRTKKLFSGYRDVSVLKTNLPLIIKNKHLFFRNKSKAGRCKNGRTVLWTKSSLKKRYTNPNINYSFRSLKLGFISSIFLLPKNNSSVSLYNLSDGSYTYLKPTTTSRLFILTRTDNLLTNLAQRTYLSNYLTFLFDEFLIKNSFFVLRRLPRNQLISLIELYPGKTVEYVRSPGSKSVMLKMDTRTNTAVIKLPSGVKKVFSIYSIASLGNVLFSNKKLLRNNKAGHYNVLGKKPIVRGVAMNPVDHPHGGRTKAIKYPRTPWGKTTKFK